MLTTLNGPTRQSGSGPARWPLVVVAVVGFALIAMPLVFNMFNKTPKGAVMIAQFKPFMTTARLDGFQTDLKEINAGVRQTDTSVATYLTAHSNQRTTLETTFPSFVTFDKEWPGIDSKMTGLMDQVQANQGNYRAVAALPSFRLFPWFFVTPGVPILAFALASIFRPNWKRKGPVVLVIFGVGLITAPVAFQMFQRAPSGGQMMSAFKNLETTANVEQIQGFFGEMAEGQGIIRIQIVPTLEQDGLTPNQVAAKFPNVTTLDARWVHILNDMTPMIGVMSDNVANYQAIASLPPFPLFPWFFVLPGLIVIGLALAARQGERVGNNAPSKVQSVSVPHYQGVS